MKRKTNPSRRVAVAKAAKLYADFTGDAGAVIAKIPMPKMPKAVAVIGELAGVMYDTVRDGKLEKYVHQFRKSARPLLCVSPDGKCVMLIGGNYTFTERGIIDKT